LTRSVKALLHGDAGASFGLHPLGWLIAPSLLVVFGVYAFRYLRTGDSTLPRWGRIVLVAGVAALLVVWLVRLAGGFGGPVPVG
jgi:hypothetical protein